MVLSLQELPTPRVLKSYEGNNLLQIAMPMGGIGAGCVCLNGSGGIQDFAIRNRPSTTARPDGWDLMDSAFALVHIRGERPLTKLLEGPIPVEKLYDQGLQAQGYRHSGAEGLPRFQSCSFESGYPFGIIRLSDPNIPLEVKITGWSPFVPNDDIVSGIPAAILEYSFTNKSRAAVDFDFSYHLSHLANGNGKWSSTKTERLHSGGVTFTNTLPSTDVHYGSSALAALNFTPQVKASWLRGGWFDGISALWREVSTGQFRENDGTGAVGDPNSRNGGSICGSTQLEPGVTADFVVAISWYFPNSDLTVGEDKTAGQVEACAADCDCTDQLVQLDNGKAGLPAWRPFYAGMWDDAGEVATYIKDDFDSLRSRTLSFSNALMTSSYPLSVIDAISSNLAILKSPTVLRQENGNVWAWEGCFTDSGCCHGSCTHVWNYAQALPHLFSRLERTLRNQELERSIHQRGHVNFRSALPDGPAPHDYHAAADGQLGGILKLCRDWLIIGDRDWLARLYPKAKLSLDYCISLWDPDRLGGLFEPHHNTYDIEFWGPDGMCGSIYVGALSAMAMMARELGMIEEATSYQELSEVAARYMAEHLFNGEYYQQNVCWEGLRNQSFADSIKPGVIEDEMTELLKLEGPKYQYGSGCISDGIIGGWMASIYGIETPLDQSQVRSTLESIYKYNYRQDLFEHACLQRPGYALGHERGLLLCSWPRGGKPTLPFVYSDEVWTGIEYQVASHLIEEGFVSEGLTIVDGVRSRYDGHVRNPFNEYECGSYYARAMASYALLSSLSGFRYSAAERKLWFGPKLNASPFKTFFSTASGFGTITLTEKSLLVSVLEGELEVQTLVLNSDGVSQTIRVNSSAAAGAPLEVTVKHD